MRPNDKWHVVTGARRCKRCTVRMMIPAHDVHRSLLAIAFLGKLGGANGHKLITGFTQTNLVTTSFKATRPQNLSPLVTTGLSVSSEFTIIRLGNLSQHLLSSCFYLKLRRIFSDWLIGRLIGGSDWLVSNALHCGWRRGRFSAEEES